MSTYTGVTDSPFLPTLCLPNKLYLVVADNYRANQWDHSDPVYPLSVRLA